MDTTGFLDWGYSFTEYVESWAKGGLKVLLVYYRNCAHLSLAVLELFQKNDIIVYVLPSHASGKTQLRDVVLFYVFKNRLQDAVSIYAAPDRGKQYDLFDLYALTRDAYYRAFTVHNVQTSFRRLSI